jgi:hypothetical protein
VVVAGTRIYDLGVASRSEKLLRSPEVEEFFDCLAIEQ